MTDDLWFERLADASDPVKEERTPARLKSRIYSALVARMADTGPLLDLPSTIAAGGHLCVFEKALTVLPLAADLQSMNPCRICHARCSVSGWNVRRYSGPAAPTRNFTTARTGRRSRRGSGNSSGPDVPAA
jgi:hypothetical protein